MSNKQVYSKSIGTIICFVGELPWYFDYFLNSCKFNSSVDFFIITDRHYTKGLIPKNVKFIYMTLDEINSLISKKLNVKSCIKHGYKICDFKPMFGLIFEEILKGYDYWAQSDIDVIYGDLRYFLDEIIADDFDYISVRHDFTTGCFSVFKNNELMNNLFWRSKDIEKVLQSPIHYCFDECNFVQQQLTDGKSIWEIPTEIYSYTHIIRESERMGEIRAHFDFILIEGITGRVKYKDGKIYYKNCFEAILYHLYELKKVFNPKTIPKKVPSVFNISPTRIYHKSSS